MIATGREHSPSSNRWGPRAYPLQAMCYRGQTEALRWFEDLFQVVSLYGIDQELVKWAACRGHLELADWLLRFDRRGLRLASYWEINLAPRDELRVRNWLAQRRDTSSSSSLGSSL